MKIETEHTDQTQIIRRRLFNQPFLALENVIDYRARRQSLISSNIANINTPNYRAFDLIMNEKLQVVDSRFRGNDVDKGANVDMSADVDIYPMDRLDATEQLPPPRPKLVPTSTPVKNDGNSVDLDLEMSKQTENQLMFTIMAQTLSKRFEQLRSVITEGRR
jgi:flagellar basal-body rod protein FlgB